MHTTANKLQVVLLGSILFVGLMLRISYLESVPPGLTMDEASIGYNAFTLRTLSTDQEGNTLPISHFKSLGDYKLPLHFYFVAVSQFFFGNTMFAIRFPGALLSAATVMTTFLIARYLFGSRVGRCAALLFAISPWSAFHARLGLETNIAIFLFTLAVFFLLKSIQWRPYMLIATVFTILTFYTHHVYWVFLPPFLLLFLVAYRKRIIPHSSKILILSLILIAISILPFILERNEGNVTRLNQSFFSEHNIAKLIEEEGRLHLTFSFLRHATVQYMNAFSLLIWYAPTGFDTVDVLPMRGLFYSFEFILFIFGLLYLLRQKNTTSFILLGWLLLFPLPLVVTGNISAARMIQLLPLPFIVEALGFREITKRFRVSIYIFAIIVIISFSRFLADMFFIYPFKFSSQTDYGYIAVRQYIKNNPSNNYYVDESLFRPLHLYYFYSIPPDNITPKSLDPGGTIVTHHKNIYIVKRGFPPPLSPRSVLISSQEDMSLTFQTVDEVKLLDGSTYALVNKPRKIE